MIQKIIEAENSSTTLHNKPVQYVSEIISSYCEMVYDQKYHQMAQIVLTFSKTLLLSRGSSLFMIYEWFTMDLQVIYEL